MSETRKSVADPKRMMRYAGIGRILKGNTQRKDLRLQRLNSELLDAVQSGNIKDVTRVLDHGGNPNATCCPTAFSALHVAALEGHAEILDVLLDKGARPNRFDNWERSPLHLAAWAGHSKCVDTLLNRCPELLQLRTGKEKQECELVPSDWQDSRKHDHNALVNKLPVLESGSTALHVSCQMANLDCIHSLLKVGADYSLKDDCMMMPLDVVGEQLVVERNSEEERERIKTLHRESFPASIQAMLQAGAKMTTDIKGIGTFRKSVMHTAVELESLSAIELLATAGCGIIFWDKSGDTPIHVGVKRRLEETLKIILQVCKSDENVIVDMLDSSGMTPLHRAVELQWMAGVNVCLEEGADIEATTPTGVTALHLAAEKGNAEILAEILKIADADGKEIVDAVNHIGETPLFRAVSGGNIDCVSLLLKSNANLSPKIACEYTLLHRATQENQSEILELLLREVQNKNLPLIEAMDTERSSGMTPLLLAAEKGHHKCAKVLIKYGGNTRSRVAESEHNVKQCTGETPLHLAANQGHDQVIRVLLQHDRSLITEMDAKGYRPIHTAAFNGHRESVRHLIEAGSDLSSKCIDKDKNVRTAIDVIINNIARPVSFLEKSLDSSITINEFDVNDVDCVVTMNYNFLFPKGEDTNQLKIIDALTLTGNRFGQQTLLLHPLLESFLYMKWEKLSLFFYALLLVYMGFVFSFSILCIMTYYYEDAGLEIPSGMNVDVCRYIVVAIVVFLVLIEILYLIQLPLLYIKESESWLKMISFALALFVSFTPHNDDNDAWLRHVTTLAVLLAWTQCLFFVSRVPHYGYYILMFVRVTVNVVEVLLTFIFLIVGFAITFMIQFQAKAPFDSPWESLAKTFMMMTGEYEYSGIFEAKEEASAIIARILFLLFVLLVGVALMNLLIGMAVNDITELEVRGKISRFRKQSEFLSMLEVILFKDFFRKLLPKNLKKRLYKHKQVPSLIHIRPGVAYKKYKKIFPCEIMDAILLRISQNQREISEPTLQDVYNSLTSLSYSVDIVTGARIRASDHIDSTETVVKVGDLHNASKKLDELCREVEQLKILMQKYHNMDA